MAASQFEAAKGRILASLASGEPDASPQGHVDPLCVPVINRLNAHPDYVTTSSCSGRISIFHTGSEDCQRKARGGGWLLVSHVPVAVAEVEAALASPAGVAGLVCFKFEPFILHVQCRSLAAAQALVGTAVAAGYRNSGLMAGTKFMVAVRSTLHLEAPVASGGRLVVDHDYLSLLTDLANQKFAENATRIDAFCSALGRSWSAEAGLPSQKAVRHSEKRQRRTSATSGRPPRCRPAPGAEAAEDGLADVACSLFLSDSDTPTEEEAPPAPSDGG